MERWHCRTVLVTGASYGMGFAIVKELLKQKMNVVACARTLETLNGLTGTLPVDHGNLHTISCDLSKEDNIVAMFNEIKNKFGHIDVLVNNAGVANFCPISEGATENLMAMINLNLLAVAFCAREAYKLMKEKNIDDGHIININSTSGHDMEMTDSDHGYSVTKHAITALTRALDMEMRTRQNRIRITSLSPGLPVND